MAESSRERNVRVNLSIRLIPTVSAVMAGLLCLGVALAGFMPMPLKAELDLAKTVVVGKIGDISKEKEEYEGKMVWGRATVAVTEPLKGTTAKEITMAVMMSLDRNLARNMQSPPRVYRQGDEGIWIVMPDGKPLHGYGLLGKNRLNEVKTALAELEKRIWSDEVGGLTVWAAADTKDLDGERIAGMVMFAVKNVSTKPIYLPHSFYTGVVSAIARDSSGKEFALRGMGDDLGTKPPPLDSQHALQPEETRYLHPDGADMGFFIIPEDLAPGKYAVSVTLNNPVADGVLNERQPVKLWTGKVTAPVFSIEIPEKPATPRPAAK